MTVPQILAWLVIFSVPVHMVALVLLRRLGRTRPDNLVLRERLYVAMRDAYVAAVFALTFINNDIIPPPFGLPVTQVWTRSAILLMAGPVLYWLWLYRRPRVDEVRERTQDTADAEREVQRDEADAAREVQRDEADAAREEERNG